MDPAAELDQVRQAVNHQGTLLGQHSQTLRDIVDGLRELSASVASLQIQSSPPASTAPSPSAQVPLPAKEPWVTPPERYDGDFGLCRSFLMQCNLVFNQQPLSYSTDKGVGG